MRFSLVHSLLRPAMRATVDRNLSLEVREQQRMRGCDTQSLWTSSFERAIDFANAMTVQSPGYLEIVRQARCALPITAASWAALPTVTKDDFRKDRDLCYGELVRKEEMMWTSTSGSTGQPFRFPISKWSRDAEIAANELNLMAVGWSPSMRQMTVKVEAKPTRSARSFLRMIAGKRSIGVPAAEFLAAPASETVERIQQANIAYLRGYSRTIYLFAQKILRQQISCPIPLITTLGEELSLEEQAVIERAFNGKVYRDYGGSEAMHIGFECREQRGYHIDLARFYIEVLRDGRAAKEGEIGEIVVTALRNEAMPLIRYRIGDLGCWGSNEPCRCGNKFPLMAHIAGRTADEMVTADGHVINLHAIANVFKYSHEHVAEFKILQNGRDSFDVLWVPMHDHASDHVSMLKQQLIQQFGGHATFNWLEVEEIHADKSGKRRLVVPLH